MQTILFDKLFSIGILLGFSNIQVLTIDRTLTNKTPSFFELLSLEQNSSW